MKIENEKIKLLAFDNSRIQHFKDDQLEIIKLFQQSCSIYEVVQHFFKKGRLVSFQGLLRVVDFLLDEKLVVNSGLYEYFKKNLASEPSFLNRLADKLTDNLLNEKKIPKPDKEKIKKIPFFRSLSPEVLNVFLQNSSVVEVPAGVLLCQEGAFQRALLVLLGGQATVYKKNESGIQKKIVVLNESSVFGESGFFFNEPRTASVITDVPSQVLMIKYIPEIYNDMIKTDKARKLQTRIWATHALLKSEAFRGLPQECFDALIFSGDFKTFPPKTLICKQGDIGIACYIVIQGSVSVVKDMVVIKNLGQGESFGEIALTFSGGRRTASVMTVTEVLVLEIGKDRFYQMLSENLLLACEFEKIAQLRIKQSGVF